MNRLKVLVVDDQEDFLHYQKDLLTEVGIDVQVTTDTSKVVGLIESFDPDLLMLDKLMNIDGLVIAEEVKQKFDFLPVLIVSTSVYDCDKRKAWTIGCIDYIRKDIDTHQFISMIKDFCLAGHFAKSVSSYATTVKKGVDALEGILISKQDVGNDEDKLW